MRSSMRLRGYRSEVEHLLRALPSDPVLSLPNLGNAGDSLIYAGTLAALARTGVSYEVAAADTPLTGCTVLLGGGGNLVPLYDSMREALRRCIDEGAGRVILLPHTIRHAQDVLALLRPGDVVGCRDAPSAAHARVAAPRATTLLAHDMAFHIDVRELLRNRAVRREAAPVLRARLADHGWTTRRIRAAPIMHFIRQDAEQVEGHPESDIDISAALMDPGAGGQPSLVDAWCLLKTIDCSRRIVTDRLHVAIGAGLLGVPVDLLPNSYDKNASVYEQSLRSIAGVRWRPDDGRRAVPPA